MQQQFWYPLKKIHTFYQILYVKSYVDLGRTVHIIQRISSSGHVEFGVGFGGKNLTILLTSCLQSDRYDLVAILPSIFPEWLGDRSFCEEMSIRFPYLSGAMANGIATTTLVQSMARQGFMGFLGRLDCQCNESKKR